MNHFSTDTTKEINLPRINENQVLNFLQDNPKFFLDNVDILGHMEVPTRWNGDKVADMQSFLLDRRSDEIDELRDCAQEVIETSRNNLSVQTRTHAAILSLIATGSFLEFIQVLKHDVPFYLDLDNISIGFEVSENENKPLFIDEIKAYKDGTAETFIGSDQEICIYPSINHSEILFDRTSKPIISCVLARIHLAEDYPAGILALGSFENIFYLDQGTDLINFLVRVIETSIKKYLTK